MSKSFFFKSETTSFHNFSQRFSKIYKIFDIGRQGVGAKRPFNGVKNTTTKKILLSKAKFDKKNFCTAILHSLLVKFSNLRQLLSITFTQGFRIFLNIQPKTFKRYLKSEQTHTHRQTHTYMEKSTYRNANRGIYCLMVVVILVSAFTY